MEGAEPKRQGSPILAECDDENGTSCGGSDVGVVTAALQAFIGETAALRQGVLET